MSVKTQAIEPPPWAAGTENREKELFPELTAEQVDIFKRYGQEKSFDDEALLWDIGDRHVDIFVILEGELDVYVRSLSGESQVVRHVKHQFTGETVSLSGRAALVAGRAKGPLKVIALSVEELRNLINQEASLGELVMQTFIVRRMRLIADRLGSVALVGSRYSKDTIRLRTFMTRNGLPHEFLDLEDASDLADFLEEFDIKTEETPIVICDGKQLRNPSERELADCLGFSEEVSEDTLYDIAVIGAGPAGLASAVYATSEGLKVVVIESIAPGGQAGTSSKIENYLGFPTGISGQALAGRAFLQAQKFGAEILVARSVKSISCGCPLHTVVLDDDSRVQSRAVVIASGAVYRRPPIPDLEKYTGGGVYYGASYVEGQLCKNQEVAIVGGGNSAGQAAVFLSERAKRVRIFVRSGGLAASMSRYLIRRIETAENIELVTYTEIVGIEGEDSLTTIHTKNNQNGETQRLETQHLFLFIGAQPSTDFAHGAIQMDEKGFVKTGAQLELSDLVEARWPLKRTPTIFESSCPRIYAVGDVRSNSTKRVASAVGEGSVVVQFIHQAIAEN